MSLADYFKGPIEKYKKVAATYLVDQAVAGATYVADRAVSNYQAGTLPFPFTAVNNPKYEFTFPGVYRERPYNNTGSGIIYPLVDDISTPQYSSSSFKSLGSSVCLLLNAQELNTFPLLPLPHLLQIVPGDGVAA